MGKTVKTIYDNYPFCLFANISNCTMRPQKKVKVEWEKFYGEWEEIFSLGTADQVSNQSHPTDIYEKSESGEYMLNTYSYKDNTGNQKKFSGNRIYPMGDESNSWYRVNYNVIPGDIPKWIRAIQAPVLRLFHANWVILNIDPNYEWCQAGHPCRRAAYLMQKKGTPQLDRSVIHENVQVLKESGYIFDDTNIVFTRPAEAHIKDKPVYV